MPLNHLTTLLNKRNARPHDYWRVLTNDYQAGWRGQWEAMYAGGYLALGWPQLGDLTNVQDRADLAVRMKAAYGEAGAMSVELYHFLTHIPEGDLVVAVEQQQVVGIGKITSGYRYEPATAETPHRRQVDWLWAGRQPMAALDAKGRLVGEIKSMLSQVTIEQWLQAPPPPKLAVTPAPHAPTPTIAIAPLRLQGVGAEFSRCSNGNGKSFSTARPALARPIGRDARRATWRLMRPTASFSPNYQKPRKSGWKGEMTKVGRCYACVPSTRPLAMKIS